MKKFSKILVIVLSVALLVGAMVIVASASDDSNIAWDENNNAIAVYTDEAAFKADKADGKYDSAAQTFNTLVDAMSFIKSNEGYSYIALTDDWSVGGTLKSHGVASLDASTKNPELTFDLNGYTLTAAVNQVKSGESTSDYWHVMTGSSNTSVTIVGNGGTVEVSLSLIQNNASGSTSVTLLGGEGGLTIRSVQGYTYDADAQTYTKNSAFRGTYFVKLASPTWTGGMGQASKLVILGDVTFERNSYSVKAGIEITGRASVTIGSSDPTVKTHVRYIEPTNIAAQQQSSEWQCRGFGYGFLTFTFGSKATDWDKHSIVAKADIINATVETFGERVASFDSNYYKVGDDDVPKITIKDSVVTMDDFVANSTSAIGSNNSHSGMFLMHWATKCHVDIESSVIRQNHGHSVFNGGQYPTTANKAKPAAALVTARDSSIISRNVKDSSAYPMMRFVGAAVFENTMLYTDTVGTYGATWRPYSAEDTVITDWPWYVDQGITNGVGVLVKAGCSTNISSIAGRRTTTGDYAKAFGIIPTSGSDADGTAVYSKPGLYANANYHTFSFTEDDTKASGTRVGQLYIIHEAGAGAVATQWKKDNIVYPFLPNSYNGQSVQEISNTNSTYDNVSLQSKDRTGKYFLERNPLDSDNVYVVCRNGNFSASGTNAPYFYKYLGRTTSSTATGSHSASNKTDYSIDNYQYYVTDIEIMTPADKFLDQADISFRFKNSFKNSSGSDDSRSSDVALKFSKTGKLTVSGASESYQLKYAPGEWMHFTIVVEMPLTDDASKVKLGKLQDDAKLHLYIDGVKVQTFTGVFPNANCDTASYYIEKSLDLPHEYAGINEIRINQKRVTKATGDNEAFAFDNVSMYYVPVSMGLTLEEAVNAHFFKSATISADLPLAGDGNGYYMADEAEDALGAYIAGVNAGKVTDGTLALYSDYVGAALNPYVLAKAAGGNFTSFTYVSNGFDLPLLDAVCTITESETAPGTYTVKIRDDFAVLTFDDLDASTPNEQIYIAKNGTISTADFPKIKNPGEITLTYGKILLDAWGLEAGKTAISADITIDKDTTLYPAIGSTKSTYTENLFFDFTLQDNLAMSLYIPVDALGGKIEGLTITGVQYHYEGGSWDECPVASGEFTYGGVKYKKYTLWPSISKYNDDTEYKIIHTATYEGVTYTFEAVYRISAISYSQYVLENNYTDQEKELVANFLRYGREYLVSYLLRNPNSSYKTRYNTAISDINAVLSNYEEKYCTAYDESIFTKNIIDTATVNAEISKYIGSISISANDSRLQYSLSDFKSEVDGYTAKVQKISASVLGPKVVNGKLITGTYTVSTGSKAGADGYYTAWTSQNIKPHNVFGVITITIEVDLFDAEGNRVVDNKQVSGQFSLATYYSKLSETSKNNYKTLFLSLYELSKSANEYRYYEAE